MPRTLRCSRIEVETEHERDGEEGEDGETEFGLAERGIMARSLGGAVDGAPERTGTQAIEDCR